MKSDLIKRLEGHIETLRGVASSVYSDDIREAIDALERESCENKLLKERLDELININHHLAGIDASISEGLTSKE